MRFKTLFLLGCVAPLAVACQWHDSSTALETTDPTSGYDLSGSVYATADEANPNGSSATYVSMAVPFGPINELKHQIESRTGLTLKDRGEAHITVLTPMELSKVRQTLSKAEANEALATASIQNADFSVICVGAGKKQQGATLLQTFFVVVDSPDLRARRAQLGEAMRLAGGPAGAFDAEHYFPHVTIGFTDRDLHEEDGVIKGETACVGPLSIDP